MQNLKLKKRDVPMGGGISLVRDMFVAETMEDAKKIGRRTNGQLYEMGMPLERLGQ